MSKKNKINKKIAFPIIGIIIFILIIGGFIIYKGGFQQTILQPPNTTPVAIETFLPSVSNLFTYKCNWDYCFVKGIMTVDKSYDTQKVIFRSTTSTYPLGDLNTEISTLNNNIKTVWTYYAGRRGGVCDGKNILYTTPQGYRICISSNDVKNIYLDNGLDSIEYKIKSEGINSFSSTPTGSCPNSKEVCDIIPTYTASYNFCPSNNLNNQFCTKTETKTDAWSGNTAANVDEVRLTRDASVRFEPKDGGGNFITDAKIISVPYDETCYKNRNISIPPNTCDVTQTNQKYCDYTKSSCPTGYTFYSSSNYCRSLDGVNIYGYRTNVCRDSSDGNICYTPKSNAFLNCDSKTTINTISCDAFGTVGLCDGGQKCFVGSATNVRGWGGCSCGVNECKKGSVQADPDVSSYQLCELQQDVCNDWITKSCGSSDLEYNPSATNLSNVCRIKTGLRCNPTTESNRCNVNGDSQKCEAVTIAGFSGYKWNTITDCNEKACDTTTGLCTCTPSGGTSLNKCVVNTQKCKDANSLDAGYLTCTTAGVNTCLDYRDKGGTCNVATQVCNATSNSCVTKTGCQYDNPACGANYDCVSNICKPKSGSGYCLASEEGKISCSTESIYTKCENQNDGTYKLISHTLTGVDSNQICTTYPTGDKIECKKTGVYCAKDTLSECLTGNNGYRKCVSDTSNTAGCYKWSSSNCTSVDTTCNSNDVKTTNKCSCKTTGDYCSVGSLKSCSLIDTNVIKECLPSGTCYKWSDTTCSLDGSKKCTIQGTSGGAECKSVGCDFIGTGFDTDVKKDKNNIQIEQCKFNDITCREDDYSCTAVDLLKTRCKGVLNIIQKCNQYTTLHKTCYRWEDELTCSGDKPVCKTINII